MATTRHVSSNEGDRITVGWREFVSLPDWGVQAIKAKIDTGARTSAIDVANLEMLPNECARFEIVVDRKHPERRVTVESPVVRSAKIKSSLGSLHERPIVETRIRIGTIEKTVQLGLVCREKMLCRVLLGRTALVPEFLVDSSHRYLFGKKRRKSQK